MKQSLVLFLIVLLGITNVYAEEEVLTKDQELEKQIQDKITEGIPTIKRFLSERGECSDILTSNAIKNWYTQIIENIATPIEVRTSTYNTQATPLKEEISLLKDMIETTDDAIETKKEEYLDSLGITSDYEKFLGEIKALQDESLKLRGELNKKNLELENITKQYESYANMGRGDVTILFETGILKHCKEWYGKVELTDKKVLDSKVTVLEGSGLGTTKKKVSKYKKILEKVSVIYIKNPSAVKKLLIRIQKVIPKISKDHPQYEIFVDIKDHIEKLVEEEEK